MSTALKTIASTRKEATVLALEYGNVPPVFVVPGKLYQSPKANLLGRLRQLNEEPGVQLATDMSVEAVSHSDISLNQLVVDLSSQHDNCKRVHKIYKINNVIF